MLQDTGFTGIRIGDAVDTFGGAAGEAKVRGFEVFGYAFLARRAVNPPEKQPRPQAAIRGTLAGLSAAD